MFESTELQQIPAGRNVACRVVRGFRPGGPDGGEHYIGDVVHLNPAVAVKLSQEGNVKVERNAAGKIVTVDDPDFLPPLPTPTARIRVLIPSRHHPIGEPETRDCAVGEIIEVLETRAVYACSGGHPSAERA